MGGMIPRNCLSQSLDRWHQLGGYLQLRCSEHWGMPHVMHVDSKGRLHNYVPPERLKNPLQALIGFDGVALDHDNSTLKPVPLRGIVLGTWLMALGVTAWAAAVLWRRVRSVVTRK